MKWSRKEMKKRGKNETELYGMILKHKKCTRKEN